jgi:cathepsin L/cathepsin K
MYNMRNKKILILVIIGSLISVGFASGYQNTEMQSKRYRFNNELSPVGVDYYKFSIDNIYDYPVMEVPIPIPKEGLNPSGFINMNSDTPATFSWLSVEGLDWTTRAKNQGNCGSCWLFASMGAFESVINIREDCSVLNPDLSEQYVLSCLPEAGSCNGGNVENCVYYFIMNTSAAGNFHNGVITDECFRYNSSFSYIPPCSNKPVNWQDFLVPILAYNESWMDVSNPELTDIIKSTVFEKGPVMAYYWVTERFQRWGALHKDDGEYYPDFDENCPNYVNHAITIVGWKDDPSIDNGGYWICKNTWGENWGYKGFFNLEYDCLNMGAFVAWVDYDPVSMDWPPVADAGGFYQGESGTAIEFDGDQSVDAEGDIVQYSWDFGDGTRGSGSKVSHTYADSGIYAVLLTVTDNSGQNDSKLTLVGIDTVPVDIRITGGVGIDIAFDNPVDEEMNEWEFSVDINGLVLPNKIYKVIRSISGGQTVVSSLSVIGFGIGLLDVSIENVSESMYFLILGPFVKIFSRSLLY